MTTFIAQIGFTHPWFPTWHGGPHLDTVTITAEDAATAENEAMQKAIAIAGDLGTPRVSWVKTAARHHHDEAQARSARETKPSRIIPRNAKDNITGDTITLRFKRGIAHTMTINGWLKLIEKCQGDMNGARAIVQQVAAGIITNHLPA